MKHINLICIMICFTAAAAVAPAATYILRPDGSGDFPTIQAAIDAAANGDVILLENGTYGEENETLDFKTKAVILRSLEGPEAVECRYGQYLLIKSAEMAEMAIEGVTIQTATQTTFTCLFSSPRFTDCRFIGDFDPVSLWTTADREGVGEPDALVLSGSHSLINSVNCRIFFSGCTFENINRLTIIDCHTGRIEINNCEFDTCQVAILADSAEIIIADSNLTNVKKPVDANRCRLSLSRCSIFQDRTWTRAGLQAPDIGDGIILPPYRESCITAQEGKTTITDCNFIRKIDPPASGGWERAIHIIRGMKTRIESCSINSFMQEGIIIQQGYRDASEADVHIIDCTITGCPVGISGQSASIQNTMVSNGEYGLMVSDTLIDNCTITDNQQYGIHSDGGISMTSTTISRNQLDGIYVRYNPIITHHFESGNIIGPDNHLRVLEGCTISENGRHGIQAKYVNLAIHDSTISRNTGSGIYYDDVFNNRSLLITGTTLAANHESAIKSPDDESSRITMEGGMISDHGRPIRLVDSELTGVHFLRNNGILLDECQADNCTFIGNHADEDGSITSSQSTFTNCFFQGNHASDGGALHCLNGINHVINCAFVANHSSGAGGAIHLKGDHASVSLRGCVLVNNTAQTGGGIFSSGQFGFADIANSIIWNNCDDGGQTAEAQIQVHDSRVFYSCVQYWPLSRRQRIINSDPQFIRPPYDGGDGWFDDPETPDIDEAANDDYGDLRLRRESPCIDAGDSTAIPAGLMTDLAGTPRLLDAPDVPDTGIPSPDGLVVDMGAYEFDPDGDDDGEGVSNAHDHCPATIADLEVDAQGCSPAMIGDDDRDGDVDRHDILTFGQCLSGPSIPVNPECLRLDIDSDGDVDMADFGAVQRCLSGRHIPAADDCRMP